MKAALKAQLGQQLTLTPQLLQSIRLLQLSTPQLELEVIRALETNPMLEREDDDSIAASADETETSIVVNEGEDALPSEDQVIPIDSDAMDEVSSTEEWGSSDWNNTGAESDPVQRLVACEGGDWNNGWQIATDRNRNAAIDAGQGDLELLAANGASRDFNWQVQADGVGVGAFYFDPQPEHADAPGKWAGTTGCQRRGAAGIFLCG